MKINQRVFDLLAFIIVLASVGLGVAETKDTASEVMETVKLGDIVVTGEKIRSFIESYPQDVAGIDDKEIRTRNILDAYDALSTLPGVDIKQSPGSAGARISIRGGGGSGSVLVMIDGRPVNTNQYGGVDLSGIPIDTIKSLVVFKPPVPVWLGPGGSAGVVYIETKKAGMEKKNTDSGRLTLRGGSFGLFAVSGSNRINTEKGGVLLAAGYNHLDGKRANSHKDSGNASVNWDRKTDGGTQFQANGKYYHSTQGVAGPTYNPTPNAEQSYDKGSLDVKIKGPLVGNTDYDLKLYGDILALEDRSNAGDIYKLDLYTSGLSGDLTLIGQTDRHSLRLGGFAEQTRVDHTLTGEHERNAVSIVAEHTFKQDKLTVATGARGDYTTDFDLLPGGSMAVGYSMLSGTQLKTRIGYSVNLPSFGQLYQPSHGSVDQVRGNPDLDEEKIVSASLGVTQAFGKDNTVSITAFMTETKDLIQYVRGADLISRPENVDKARKQGVELSVKFKVTETVACDGDYVYQHTENMENGNELLYSPRHQGKLAVKYVTPFKTRIESTLRAYSRQYSDAENTNFEKISGYMSVDGKIVQPFRLFGHATEGFVQLANLFDRNFDVHYGYPDDGFRFTAGVSVTL